MVWDGLGRSGTVLRWSCDGSGTGLGQVWQWSGTGLGQVWDWSGDGPGLRGTIRVILVVLARLLLSGTVWAP